MRYQYTPPRPALMALPRRRAPAAWWWRAGRLVLAIALAAGVVAPIIGAAAWLAHAHR